MAVRSKLLALDTTSSTANADKLVYTVPSGETTLFKSAVFRWRNATAGVFRITVRTPAASKFAVYELAMVNGQSAIIEPNITIPEGYDLMVRSTVASAVELVFSGAELEGIAD